MRTKSRILNCLLRFVLYYKSTSQTDPYQAVALAKDLAQGAPVVDELSKLAQLIV